MAQGLRDSFLSKSPMPTPGHTKQDCRGNDEDPPEQVEQRREWKHGSPLDDRGAHNKPKTQLQAVESSRAGMAEQEPCGAAWSEEATDTKGNQIKPRGNN